MVERLKEKQMSHITKHPTKVRDITMLAFVAAKLNNAVQATEEVKMFGSQKVEAVLQVKLKGWRYPIAIDKDGNIHYDHFGSDTDTMKYLGELLQAYNVGRTEAIIPFDQVESYNTETLENGDIKMVLEYA
jgi:hypothetical protein